MSVIVAAFVTNIDKAMTKIRVSIGTMGVMMTLRRKLRKKSPPSAKPSDISPNQ